MSNYTVDVKVSGFAYFFGVPVLFAGIVLASAIVVDIGAAVLTMGWLAMMWYGIDLVKSKRKNK